MTTAVESKERVQEVKGFILRYAQIDRWNNNSASEFNDEAQTIIELVSKGAYGFASEIAQTVVKYNFRISEKQAYWIARVAVENDLTGNINYLFEEE